MIKILQNNHKICKNYKKKITRESTEYKKIIREFKNYKKNYKTKEKSKKEHVYISMKLICQLYFVT